MKKLVYSLFIIAFSASTLLAQDDGDKKVKLGITLTPAVNWLTPGNDKKLTNNGSVVKMGIGLAADFRLTDIIWFHTGVEYTGAGGKLGYKASDTAEYYYKDDAIQEVKATDAGTYNSAPNTDAKMKRYDLLARNYKVGYIHIPLGFKLKTKELGGITYYGQIGGDLFVRTSAKGDDEVQDVTPTLSAPNGTYAASTISGNKLGGVVNLVNGAAHVGAGMEYRISGSTAIMASIQYRHGIMNFTNNGTDMLLQRTRDNSGTTYTQFANDSKLRQIVLTVGIMF